MGRYRLLLKQVEVKEIDHDLWEAHVTLSALEKSYTGVSKGPSGDDAHMRLVVEATLDAITQALKRPVNFTISDIALREMNGQKQKFIVVLLKTDYFIQSVSEAVELLGACQLSGSQTECAARATLNATNRAVSLLLK
jgi:hypothetical protein